MSAMTSHSLYTVPRSEQALRDIKGECYILVGRRGSDLRSCFLFVSKAHSVQHCVVCLVFPVAGIDAEVALGLATLLRHS